MQLRHKGEDSVGIEAMERIPKMKLLCEYATDVIPAIEVVSSRWKDHVMCYGNGRTSREELMLAPLNCSNWGPLLNHSNRGNCGSLRVVIEGKIRLLLYSKKDIKAHEELLYNYNGFYSDYPTEGFEDYTTPKKK